jgi:hypothetical protein
MTTYAYKYNDVKATATYDGSNLVILKGSTVVGDDALTHAFLTRDENQSRRHLRKKLIDEGKLVKHGSSYIFTLDVAFNSPSQAATIVAGSSKNGPLEFGLPSSSELFNESKNIFEYFEVEEKSAIEGYKVDALILSTHRNQGLVKERKELDNYTCQSCGFKLQVDGKYVIECHHLNPLAEQGETDTSIPDLISLCPTCHRIAHLRKPPYTPNEVSELQKT